MPADDDADFRQLTRSPRRFRRETVAASRLLGWLAALVAVVIVAAAMLIARQGHPPSANPPPAAPARPANAP
jgi:hypothetical protein